MKNLQNRSDLVFHLITSFLVTYTTFYIIYKWHTEINWDDLIAASQGVLDGRPHWKAYQNRLLMPFIISQFEYMMSQKNAFLFVYFVGIFIHNLTFLICFSKIFSCTIVSVAIIFWSFLFILHQNYWFYPWDIFDISLYLLIWYILYSKNYVNFLLIIFPLALLNRESALFLPIAYWLVKIKFKNEADLKSLFFTIWSHIWSKTTLISIIFVIAGVVWTLFIRDYLFIERSVQYDGKIMSLVDVDDTRHHLIGNHFNFLMNLKLLLIENWMTPNFIFSIISLFFIKISITNIFSKNNLMPKITSFFYIIILLNILIFGVFNETRMHFVLFGYYLLYTSLIISKEIKITNK